MATPRRKPQSARNAKPRTKTERKREAKRKALPDVLRKIIDNPHSVKIGRPTDYTPEACGQVIALMKTGLSLTAAAGAMGISRTTIHRWMAEHPEFRDSVEVGKAARVCTLETDMLDTDQSAIVTARRFALVNAAPDDWREKQSVEIDTPEDSPIRQLAKQLMGTAIRPQLPQPKVIDHDPNEMRVIRPQQQRSADPVPTVTTLDGEIDSTDVIEAEPAGEIDEYDDGPRIHTISPDAFEDDDDEEA